MSADDLWCSWCRQPHAPCATTPAMEAERAATLRARLQERYECPERPCTYDPADEVPESGWRVHNPNPACSCIDCKVALGVGETSGTFNRYDPADEEPEAEPVADREVIIPARSEYTPGPWPATYIVRFEGDTYSCADCPTCKAPIFVLAGTGIPTTGELDARSGVIARNTDWTPHTCPTVEPKPLTDDYRDGDVEDTGPAIGRPGLPYRILHAELKSLRSYLRTLTNPDAPAEDVAAALDLLTDGDFALVDPRNVEGFKLLNALPLMKRVRA